MSKKEKDGPRPCSEHAEESEPNEGAREPTTSIFAHNASIATHLPDQINKGDGDKAVDNSRVNQRFHGVDAKVVDEEPYHRSNSDGAIKSVGFSQF